MEFLLNTYTHQALQWYKELTKKKRASERESREQEKKYMSGFFYMIFNRWKKTKDALFDGLSQIGNHLKYSTSRLAYQRNQRTSVYEKCTTWKKLS